MKPFRCFVLAAFFIPPAIFGQRVSKATGPLDDLSTAVEAVARAASPSVVQITVHARAPLENDESNAGFLAKQQATGSGVILDPDGYIITNNHVVDGAQKIDVSVAAKNQPDGARGTADRRIVRAGVGSRAVTS